MYKFNRWLPLLAASAMAVMSPMQVLASPSFAYSAEVWAKLQDNNLEYDEITNLVHEYNATVLNNQITYKDKKDKNADDIAQDYRDAAAELSGNITYPDSDSAMYGSLMAAAINSEKQVASLEEQADNNVSDNETIKLGYDQVEAGLVNNAQLQMISYYQQQKQLETLKVQKELAESQYQSAVTKQTAGMATNAEVLSAKQQISTIDANILSTESGITSTKKNLMLLTGWKYDSDPVIGDIPTVTAEEIAAVDLAADTAKALENNYTLKISRKSLQNSQSESVKNTWTNNIKSQEQTVTSSVKTAYQNLILAKSNYDQAVSSLELEQKTLATAERQYASGTMSRAAYEQEQNTCNQQQITVNTQEIALVQSWQSYQSAVNGLAAAS